MPLHAAFFLQLLGVIIEILQDRLYEFDGGHFIFDLHHILQLGNQFPDHVFTPDLSGMLITFLNDPCIIIREFHDLRKKRLIVILYLL